MVVGELWVSTAKGRGHVRLGGRTNVTLKAGSFLKKEGKRLLLLLLSRDSNKEFQRNITTVDTKVK